MKKCFAEIQLRGDASIVNNEFIHVTAFCVTQREGGLTRQALNWHRPYNNNATYVGEVTPFMHI